MQPPPGQAQGSNPQEVEPLHSPAFHLPPCCLLKSSRTIELEIQWLLTRPRRPQEVRVLGFHQLKDTHLPTLAVQAQD